MVSGTVDLDHETDCRPSHVEVDAALRRTGHGLPVGAGRPRRRQRRAKSSSPSEWAPSAMSATSCRTSSRRPRTRSDLLASSRSAGLTSRCWTGRTRTSAACRSELAQWAARRWRAGASRGAPPRRRHPARGRPDGGGPPGSVPSHVPRDRHVDGGDIEALQPRQPQRGDAVDRRQRGRRLPKRAPGERSEAQRTGMRGDGLATNESPAFVGDLPRRHDGRLRSRAAAFERGRHRNVGGGGHLAGSDSARGHNTHRWARHAVSRERLVAVDPVTTTSDHVDNGARRNEGDQRPQFRTLGTY